MKKNNLTFPVLIDKDNSFAEQLNLVFPLPVQLREVYTTLGIDLPKFNGNDSWKLPMPGRFLIDSSGIIKSVDVHPDHTLRSEPSDIIDFMK